MNIRRLRIFQSAAKYKSFTQAAHQLYMTQPAVSKAIMELEEEVQTPLFERFPKKVVLTPEGEAFLLRVQALLAHYDDVVASAQMIKSTSTLRIGSSITIANNDLSDMLQTLSNIYPDIQLEVEVASSSIIVDKLRQQTLDIAFAEGVFKDDDMICEAMNTYRILPVANPSFLKAHPIKNLTQMTQLPLLLREEGSAIREVVESAFLLHDIPIKPLWTSTNSSVLLKAAVQGFGISFLPEDMVQKKLKQNVLKEIKIKNFYLENVNHIVYLKHKHVNDAMQQLIQIAKHRK